MQIEKIQVTRSDNDLATKTLEAINKINEIIDWIDDVSNFRVINKQVTANLPNIDIGELAYLQKENSDLKDEVGLLQKKLEISKKIIKTADNIFESPVGWDCEPLFILLKNQKKVLKELDNE